MTYPLKDDSFDSDIAIVGRKGTGKSYTAKGIVERLLTMGRRVLVLDPLGVWAGLRTGADGKTPGFPIAIFGGAHGDLPLDPAAAVPMADILARENVPAVIDLADLSKTAQQTFLLSFLRELRRVNVEALTIVLEEADVFAPQNPMGDDSKQLHGEIDWIARRGRFKGFRLITITQRPARLSKDVLTQCTTLIAHRLPAPQDRAAVKDWVDGNGDRDEAKKVFDTLAQLAVGEAWVWASDQGTLKRERFPKIKTLDTSATPKAGEHRVVPKTLADVDLSKIKTAMAEATKEKPAKAVVGRAATAVEIEAAEQRGYDRGVRAAAAHISGFSLSWTAPEGRKGAAFETSDRQPVGQAFSDAILDLLGKRVDSLKPAPAKQIEHKPRANTPAPKLNGSAASAGLSGPQRQFLKALAWWKAMGHSTPSRAQLAAIAGWRITSGHLKNVAGSLSSAGLISYPRPGSFAFTAAGEAQAPQPDTGATLIESLSTTLTGPQKTALDTLLANNRRLSRPSLAERCGWEPTSGHVKNVVGSLSTLEIVEYPAPGVVALQEWVR